MSNVSVIHLTVDCHVWTVCSDSFDNTDTSLRYKYCYFWSRSGFGKLFNYDKPGKLL